MELRRFWLHLNTPDKVSSRLFSPTVLDEIERAVKAVEATHGGEICFAVESRMNLSQLWRDIKVREPAAEVFSNLRVWDTQQNNGVLVYLLLAEQRIEILADRGFREKVSDLEWASICSAMQQSFTASGFAEGVQLGIQLISEQMRKHFPVPDGNELPNKPTVL